jgi:hypothetical protein
MPLDLDPTVEVKAGEKLTAGVVDGEAPVLGHQW